MPYKVAVYPVDHGKTQLELPGWSLILGVECRADHGGLAVVVLEYTTPTVARVRYEILVVAAQEPFAENRDLLHYLGTVDVPQIGSLYAFRIGGAS